MKKKNIERTNFLDTVAYEEREDYLMNYYQGAKQKKKFTFLIEYFKYHKEIPRMFNK